MRGGKRRGKENEREGRERGKGTPYVSLNFPMLRVESGEEMHDPRRRPGHPYPSKIPDLHQFVVNVGRAYVDVFTQSPERSS